MCETSRQVDTAKRVKIAEVLEFSPNRDFTEFCDRTNKVYCDELVNSDYVAFRVLYGYSREDVSSLRSVIEKFRPDSSELTNQSPNREFEATELPVKSRKEIIDEKTLAEIYSLSSADFVAAEIESIPTCSLQENDSFRLSLRSKNALLGAKCKTLSDVLKLTRAQLSHIRNMGAKSVQEVCDFVAAVAAGDGAWLCRDVTAKERSQAETSTLSMREVRLEAIRTVLKAELAGKIFPTENLSLAEKEYLKRGREAVLLFCSETDENNEQINVERAKTFLRGDVPLDYFDYVKRTLSIMAKFFQKEVIAKQAVNNAEKLLQYLDWDWQGKKIYPFVAVYRVKNQQIVDEYLRFLLDENAVFDDYVTLVSQIFANEVVDAEKIAEEITKFEKWLQGASLKKAVTSLFAPVDIKKTRYNEVLFRRATGETLETIGQAMGVTRERIRQMEVKASHAFVQRYRSLNYNLPALVYAHSGERVLQKTDITTAIGEKNSALFWCYLSSIDTEYGHYDRSHDVILITLGDSQVTGTLLSEQNKLVEWLDCLPDYIETVQLESGLEDFASQSNLPREILDLAVASHYRKMGGFSCKKNPTMVWMCGYILKNRFPNGYKIADETDGALFLSYLSELFGKTATARAIDAKMADIGVLCDRGKYIHPDYVSVSPVIIKAIDEYIEGSYRAAITYREIFAALGEKLAGSQITNRHFLQGVLKLHGCKYAMHRDYISKADGDVTAELSTFVKQRGIASKQDILSEFLGWNDINIMQTAARCPNLINVGDGCYLHTSRLKISEKDVQTLSSQLELLIGDVPVSARFLLNEFMESCIGILVENNIETPDKLFGVLQYLFSDSYYFSRPYIMRDKKSDVNSRMVILQYLTNVDVISVDELYTLCSEQGIGTQYLLERVRPDFLRVDEDRLMRQESIGLTVEIIQTASELLSETIETHRGYIAAKNISDFGWYPSLNIPWTPFLLESVAALAVPAVAVLRMTTSLRTMSSAIFVGTEYADDDYNGFLVKILKKEHAREPFRTKEEIHKWLQDEGLCNVKYPIFLDKEHHIYFNDEEILVVE